MTLGWPASLLMKASSALGLACSLAAWSGARSASDTVPAASAPAQLAALQVAPGASSSAVSAMTAFAMRSSRRVSVGRAASLAGSGGVSGNAEGA